MFKYGDFSGPYSVQMRENTDQKKLRIWTHFTQRNIHKWKYESNKSGNISYGRMGTMHSINSLKLVDWSEVFLGTCLLVRTQAFTQS